jgi:hypothetical protein
MSTSHSSPQYDESARSGRFLSWKEALAILETTDAKGVPTPFAIEFCTADEQRGTGGEIIRYHRAVWHVTGGRIPLRETPAATASTTGPARTRNSQWLRRIRAVDTDEIRSLHLHLILSINHQPVR